MRRQSNRYSCNSVMQPEQQITQYLIEHPLINAILDDDEDKVRSCAEKLFLALSTFAKIKPFWRFKSNQQPLNFWNIIKFSLKQKS